VAFFCVPIKNESNEDLPTFHITSTGKIMSQKTRFTLQQHETLGIELQQMRKRLGEMTIELNKSYPKEIANLAMNAQAAVSALQNEMDNQIKHENIGSDTAPETYFRDSNIIDDMKRKLNHTKYLMSVPVDFEQLEQNGLLVKNGEKYTTTDINELPKHVLQRIKFIEQEDGVTYVTLNESGITRS
jgi:hypothetical protein